LKKLLVTNPLSSEPSPLGPPAMYFYVVRPREDDDDAPDEYCERDTAGDLGPEDRRFLLLARDELVLVELTPVQVEQIRELQRLANP
jgi:hypothetical protein